MIRSMSCNITLGLNEVNHNINQRIFDMIILSCARDDDGCSSNMIDSCSITIISDGSSLKLDYS